MAAWNPVPTRSSEAFWNCRLRNGKPIWNKLARRCGAETAGRSPAGGSWPGGQLSRPALQPWRHADPCTRGRRRRSVAGNGALHWGLRTAGRAGPGRHGRGLQGPAGEPQPPGRPQDDPGRRPCRRGATWRGSAPRPRPSPACSTPTSSRSTRSASTRASRSSPLEFCAGGSLDRKLDGTPLPPREAAQLVETLARAMHAAHQSNVIHRDLKPANVLLMRRRHAQDHRLRPGQEAGRAGQTATGAIMGTPSYMAPEQAGGKKPRSVGPGLRHLCPGRDPVRTADGPAAVRGGDAAGHVLQVVNDEPVPPAQLQPQDAGATWRRSA